MCHGPDPNSSDSVEVKRLLLNSIESQARGFRPFYLYTKHPVVYARPLLRRRVDPATSLCARAPGTGPRRLRSTIDARGYTQA